MLHRLLSVVGGGLVLLAAGQNLASPAAQAEPPAPSPNNAPAPGVPAPAPDVSTTAAPLLTKTFNFSDTNFTRVENCAPFTVLLAAAPTPVQAYTFTLTAEEAVINSTRAEVAISTLDIESGAFNTTRPIQATVRWCPGSASVSMQTSCGYMHPTGCLVQPSTLLHQQAPPVHPTGHGHLPGHCNDSTVSIWTSA